MSKASVSRHHALLFVVAVGAIGSVLLFGTSAGGEISAINTLAPTSEGSGLAASQQHNGVFWWIRDGGTSTAAKPREAIYAMKMDDNGRLQKVRGDDKFPFYKVSGVSNTNWEDIAVDDDKNVWIGDIGANNCGRTNQKLIKVKEPSLSQTSNLSVSASYNFRFPDPADGCKTWNSEAMFWLDGKMYIFAKTRNSPIYRVDLPSGNSGTATLKRLGTLKGGVSNISVSSISDDRSRLMVAAHKQMFVYETSKTNLTGDDLVRELISNSPKYNTPFNCNCTKNATVEGGAFFRNSYNAAYVSENKYIYFADSADYGDGSQPEIGGGTGDTTPPRVTVNSPVEDATVSGTITIEVDASDSSGIRSVKISHEDGVIRNGTSEGNYGWGSRFDTRKISDGEHTITVRAEDKVGNKVTVERNIIVKNNQGDSQSPNVSIDSPADGATVSGKITIRVTAWDNVALAQVRLLYDNSGIIRGGDEPGTYGWGSRFDTNKLSNGSHTITARATDTSGNVSTSTITIVVRN